MVLWRKHNAKLLVPLTFLRNFARKRPLKVTGKSSLIKHNFASKSMNVKLMSLGEEVLSNGITNVDVIWVAVVIDVSSVAVKRLDTHVFVWAVFTHKQWGAQNTSLQFFWCSETRESCLLQLFKTIFWVYRMRKMKNSHSSCMETESKGC